MPGFSALEFCSIPEYSNPFHPFLILSTPAHLTLPPPHPTPFFSLSLFLDFCPNSLNLWLFFLSSLLLL